MPLHPKLLGNRDVAIVPEMFQAVSQHVDFHQRAMGLVNTHAVNDFATILHHDVEHVQRWSNKPSVRWRLRCHVHSGDLETFPAIQQIGNFFPGHRYLLIPLPVKQ